jgi:hypothetical protein
MSMTYAAKKKVNQGIFEELESATSARIQTHQAKVGQGKNQQALLILTHSYNLDTTVKASRWLIIQHQ